MRALFISAVLLLAACDSRPSQPPKSIDAINQIVRIADEALAMAQVTDTETSTANSDAALEKVNDALRAAHSEINDLAQQISVGKYLGRGSIEPRNVGVCIQVNASTLDMLQNECARAVQLSDAMNCATSTKTYFGSVSNRDGAAAALGMGAIYPMVLAAYVKSGLTVANWLEEYRAANDSIVDRFAAECRERVPANPAGSEQVPYKCAAYAVAKAVQPKLTALAPPKAAPR